MSKVCAACGHINEDMECEVCPTCERYYVKTDALYAPKDTLINEDKTLPKSIDETWAKESLDNKEKELTKASAHKFQKDLDITQSASDVGSTLSVLASVVHLIVLAVILYAVYLNSISFTAGFIYFFTVVISWAITYALLSIVVTNALTAKYSIYQSSKVQKDL